MEERLLRRLLITGFAAMLASCSAEPVSDQTAADMTEAQGSPPAPDAPEAYTPSAIPAALHGRWGLTPADCTSTRGDAKGLLQISGNQLRFYESRGMLGRIEEADASRIVAEFDFTGEGMSWRRRMILDVEDDGQTLVRRETGPDAMAGPLRYRRCANG